MTVHLYAERLISGKSYRTLHFYVLFNYTKMYFLVRGLTTQNAFEHFCHKGMKSCYIMY